MRIYRLLATALLFCLPSVLQSQIAEIAEPTATDFGLYQPDTFFITPMLPDYELAPDFSDVTNFNRFKSIYLFNDHELGLLQENHFFARKGICRQFYDYYNQYTWDRVPVFVTTDAVLHIYHVLFERLLTDIEVRCFIPAVQQMIGSLIVDTQVLCNATTDKDVREAALRNLAYLHVARCLLDGELRDIPENVRHWVEAEWNLVQAHAGYAFSPIFGPFSELDYSRFKPRGHYTHSESLRRYFQVLTWLGQMIFTVEAEKFGDLAERHTLQALLLTQHLGSPDDSQAAAGQWNLIIEPTNFFVGRPDDPAVPEYRGIAERIYGEDWLELPADSLANANLLAAFMAEAQKLREPEIPNWIYGTFTSYKGFRFMGMRTIPDSYLFSRLVMPYVANRTMPKGLDVMAALGSDRAAAILEEFYQQSQFANYGCQLAALHAEFAAKPAADWAQNLYWNWLYTLAPLLTPKGSGYPTFMKSPAWADKELMTALASWAQLRHDTILYAKQSETPRGIVTETPRSYVEPNPQLYARLGALLRYTRDGLARRGLLNDDYNDKIDLFAQLLAFLRDVAGKELQNTPLTEAEYKNLFCFGKVAKVLLVETDASNPDRSQTDQQAVIADVHTDANSGLCLEEGVAYPLQIFVVVREGEVTRLTAGAIFSYYEFAQPIEDRLDDERWREMLATHSEPAMPIWLNSFTDVSTQWHIDESVVPENCCDHSFTTGVQSLSPQQPQGFCLLTCYPNPFNPKTILEVHLASSAQVELDIYAINGRLVRSFKPGQQSAGRHPIVWDGLDEAGVAVGSGIYFCRVRSVSADGQILTASQKMSLVR